MQRLRENVTAVLREVDHVFIVDNASTNGESIQSLAEEHQGIRVYVNPVNLGIAKALNQIFEAAMEQDTGWVLLLDQDSVCSAGMVDILASKIAPGICVVAPSIVDRSDTKAHPTPSDNCDVNYCITSGSLSEVNAWRSVGGYDESMFIDFVDFDYCLRLRAQGLRIMRAPEAHLLHEIGKITRHGPFIAYNHSATRSYHMARDMLYYAYKHRRARTDLKVQSRGLAATYLVLIRKALIVAVFEEDRLRRVSALVRGMVSGTFLRRHVA